MKPILASELDEYINSLNILDDGEDDIFIFDGILRTHKRTGNGTYAFSIKPIDGNDDYTVDRYFEIDIINIGIFLFITNKFDFEYNNIEIEDVENNTIIFSKNNLKEHLLKKDFDVNFFTTDTATEYKFKSSSYNDEETENLIYSIENETFNEHEVIVKLW